LYPIDLSGKTGVVFGVANDKSIAWAIAETLHDAGANLALTYQNDRLKSRAERLVSEWDGTTLWECDVTDPNQIGEVFQELKDRYGEISFVVHSVAFANKEDLIGEFSETSREGFMTALDVSAYSLIPIVKHAAPLMTEGGSIVTITFHASEKVYPGYNVMGTAKAALENEVKQLAAEMGPKEIRVNALSPGPLDTLAARGIGGFLDMKRVHEERAPLRRNTTHKEVGKAALFLCSELSSGITGTILPVDGGYHIMGV